KRAASPSPTGITTSSPRTTGARIEPATAAAIHTRERTRSAFAIRSRQSVEYGYASVSSTIHEEYASEGIIAAPAAAKRAGVRPTTIRARKYVGKMTDVITRTSTYLIVANATDTSWISQIGAIS